MGAGRADGDGSRRLDVPDPHREEIRRASAQTRGGKRRPRELTVHLLDVIEVDVTVAAHPDRLVHPEADPVGLGMDEEGVGREVEGYAEKDVAASSGRPRERGGPRPRGTGRARGTARV